MKHNHDEETNSSIQNTSKPKSINRIGVNDTIQRNHLFNHDKAQFSGSKDKDRFESNNVKNYFGNSRQLTPSCNKLNRNLGEHMLIKDLEYTQSIKSFCFTSNAGINCINEEDSIIISTGNNKKYTQRLLNNGRNTKLTIRDDFTNKLNNNNIAHMLTSNVKLYEDKTTYCRPVLNYYNQQFIYKTMERNAKLKHLVKKLSIARQREKEKVNWNNYINELKNKHRYDHNDALLEDVTPEIINDFDNTTFSWPKSGLCRNILQDFYGDYDMSQPNRIQVHQQPPQNLQYLPSNTNPYCYPTSSLGRLIMLRREQDNYKYLKCKSEEAEKICNSERHDDALAYKSCVTNHGYKDMNLNNFKSSLVQVDSKVIPPLIDTKEDKGINNRKVLCRSNETNTVDKLNYITLEKTNYTSLVNIENKLECLTEAINRFMGQIKSRKRFDRDVKCKTVSYNTAEKTNRKLNMTKSDSLGMRDKENKVLRDVTANSSGSTLSTAFGSPNEYNSNINDILKEVETYNQVDFQKQYKNKLNKPCSVQISIEVPTKDCCTEVTKSLSKQKVGDEVTIEEIITPETPTIQEKMLPIQRMTIAVNTDPLSFLALLRFSTETLKRLMSYMPNFDYLSYLSALSFLQTPRTTSYICKICGAAFDNPTKLSDHIHGHQLGKARDCCVCRHVLERVRSSFFSCQYCGQHFTRAYCCELHQQSCAKRLGRCHNAASSLMLLR